MSAHKMRSMLLQGGGVAPVGLQQAQKGAFGQQLHVFGKHG
jgi:hypothetical protein